MSKPYVGENTVLAIIKNIKNLFASKEHSHDDVYYTQEQINSMEVITVAEIDAICGTSIQKASEVLL